jgi:two-component system, response regulator YesN
LPDHDRVYHSVKTVENFAEIRLEVQRFIEANFENPKLALSDFVQAKGISQRQATRALSWHSTTWSRMLLDERLKRAKELLRHSGESTETIATRAGYGSLAQFTRTFKAEEGMGPEEYRQ